MHPLSKEFTMRHSLLILPLAAALLSSSASAGHFDSPSEASLAASAVIVLIPVSVVAAGSYVVASTVEELSSHHHWHVTEVKSHGENTAVQLRSDDDKFKLGMQVPTATARAHGLQPRDVLAVEAVGKAGFLVKKGDATVGVLPAPGAGMVHSKSRG
jgi:hypothetical protein